jgi:hypothetical protein
MKLNKQFSPAKNETPTAEVAVTTSSSIGNIPTKDADFSTVANSANEKWKETPELKLLWIDQPTFADWVSDYDTSLADRLTIGSNRPAQTQTLAQTNLQIDDAVKEVRVYIQKKYKKANATAQFSRFGIVKENKTYILPRDNDKRKKSLVLMKDAIATDGFGTEEFGTTFWKNITNAFNEALKNTIDTTKKVSNKVSTKDTNRAKIHKALIALTKLIEANYPDTYKQILREWGFIKQNY